MKNDTEKARYPHFNNNCNAVLIIIILLEPVITYTEKARYPHFGHFIILYNI